MSSPSSLQNNGMYQIYFGLGDNWWKQIIDGKAHEHGKDVFDQGLHGGSVEPGFLNGISLGSKKAIELFYSSDLSVDTYKNIHKVTCSHFDGDRTGTSEAGTPGNFRAPGRSIREYLPVNSFGDTSEEREIMQNFLVGILLLERLRIQRINLLMP